MQADPPPPPPPPTTSNEPLSELAQGNLEQVADLFDREDAKVGRVQGWIEDVSSFFGSPAYLISVAVFIAAWVAVNLYGWMHHWRYVDDPPFYWLQGLVSSNALLVTVSVLIRQNRMAQLAEQRAHLDLQINMLTERKVTQLLELVQTLGRGRITPEKEAEVAELLAPTDVEALMQVIQKNVKETGP